MKLIPNSVLFIDIIMTDVSYFNSCVVVRIADHFLQVNNKYKLQQFI